jgi:LacI family transcriptional regulator
MRALRVLTAAEQVEQHLRAELCRGAWGGRMPGGSRLAAELGVGRDTVEAALRLLEQAGMLVPQGAGRRRRIALPIVKAARPLRVAILDHDPPALALAEGYVAELLHLLGEAGHSVFFADKSLQELHMDVGRVARLVRRTEADAWLVGGGSREVLQWFAAQPAPTFALFGRRRGLLIAGVGPDKPPALATATRALIGLGHQRIVLLCRHMRRLPVPGRSEGAFLNELDAHGIVPSAYHLPDWDESIEGFHGRLESLFRITPPTALIVDEVQFFFATMQFLMNRGLRVPQDVSLVCTDGSPIFEWGKPTVAHWDTRPVVRRIVRWAATVSRGEKDLRQTLTKAEFFEGGTIGPATGG